FIAFVDPLLNRSCFELATQMNDRTVTFMESRWHHLLVFLVLVNTRKCAR
ncbi:hypothetical protein Bpfe_006947, partial [Biomphalaria pfeifferi]